MMAPFKMLCVITGLAIGTNVVVKCLSAKQYRERLITVSEISKLEKLIDGQVSQLGVCTADIAAANHGAVPLYHSTWQTLCFIHKCWGSVITLLDLTDRVKKSNVHYSKELQSDPTNQCIREQCESLDTSLSLLHQRSHSISSAFMALVAEAIGKRWSRLPPEATTQQRLLDASMDSIQEIVSEIGDWNSINDELG